MNASEVQHGTRKQWLLFAGLIFKGLAISDPLPVSGGEFLKSVANIIWMAFDGAFLYLLQPPKEEKPFHRFELDEG